MIKSIVQLSTALLFISPAWAETTAPSRLVIDEIEALLAHIDCHMDTNNITIDDGNYKLDDVICKGDDHFDIVLDKNFEEISRSAK